MKIKGEYESRRVWIDGRELHPEEGQKIRNRSPDGFNWGYGGSGPAQLALTLIIEAANALNIPKVKALPYYQTLKWEFVANLPGSDFEIEFDLADWLCRKMQAQEASHA